MIYVAFDTETALIRPGCAAPPMTCMSFAIGDDSMKIFEKGLLSWRDARKEWLSWVEWEDVRFIGHHIPYDHAVLAAEYPDLMPLIFALYDEDRIHDTRIRQMLLDNARGRLGGFQPRGGPWINYKYNLKDLSKRLLKKELEKDVWRLRYGELRDVPIDQWEEGARQYPIEDAVSTFEIFVHQERQNAEVGGGWLVDEKNQVASAWAWQLASVWGIRTDPAKVDAFERDTEANFKEFEKLLQERGLVRANGVRDLKAVTKRLTRVMGGEENCRRTDPSKKFPKGQVALDEDALVSSGDLVLESYAQFTKLKAVMSKDIPMLRRGRYLPIHTTVNPLLNTGRTSTSNPNIQNIRRLVGIRECFVPREGKVFVSADYDGLELRTLGQVCMTLLGWSDLAKALNAGRDPHLEVAAHILKIEYDLAKQLLKAGDKDVKDKRQLGKVVNFGCPGGLGAETLTFYAKANYGVILTVEQAEELRDTVWKVKWPEMPYYFKHVNEDMDSSTGKATIVQLFSGRVRGGCTYTAACNTRFQGLGADATKAAFYLISKACYADESSPLYGARVVNYVHDEFILEVDEAVGHECAMELARLMVEGAAPWLPDVPPKVSEPMVMRYWSKDAKQVWKDGRLVPWAA